MTHSVRNSPVQRRYHPINDNTQPEGLSAVDHSRNVSSQPEGSFPESQSNLPVMDSTLQSESAHPPNDLDHGEIAAAQRSALEKFYHMDLDRLISQLESNQSGNLTDLSADPMGCLPMQNNKLTLYRGHETNSHGSTVIDDSQTIVEGPNGKKYYCLIWPTNCLLMK